MSGALEAICEDAEDFKDAICEQVETFFHLYFTSGYALKTTEKTPFFLEKRGFCHLPMVISSLNQTTSVIC